MPSDLERLGPVIFRQRQDHFLIAEICITVFLLAGAVALIIYSLNSPFKGEIYIALFSLLLPVAMALVTLNQRLRVFQCHENGISLRTWYGDRGLLFDEIEICQFNAFRYDFIIPTRTAIRLRFYPNRESGLKSIAFIGNLATQSAGMESLRKRVAEFVARRMILKLSEEGSVPWTPLITLEENGVRARPMLSNPFNRPKFIPYEEIEKLDIINGVLWISRRGKIWPAINESVGVVNFFPGLVVLNKILENVRENKNPTAF